MYLYNYPRAALTVDAIIVAGKKESNQILLIKRGKDPYKDLWALPGGFINLDETLEESCRRELSEETGFEIESLFQFKAFDAISRDPRHRTISVVFYSFIDQIKDVTGMDDAAEAKWFQLNDLPTLAFDHSEIIEEFIVNKKLI
ncbi:MAG: NUDIX hydrolase [Mariniphaga sp.]|nr:NUDIX hydrolase [Mariniphaga sp.]